MYKKVSEDEKGKKFHLVSEQLAQILKSVSSSPGLSKEFTEISPSSVASEHPLWQREGLC